jgi:hypothetical protein
MEEDEGEFTPEESKKLDPSRRGYSNEKNASDIADAIAALGFGLAVKDSGTQDDR